MVCDHRGARGSIGRGGQGDLWPVALWESEFYRAFGWRIKLSSACSPINLAIKSRQGKKTISWRSNYH